MSPTLLEGVVILVILVVAWQIGIYLAPVILSALKRSVDQLNGSRSQQDTTKESLTDKESPNDKP